MLTFACENQPMTKAKKKGSAVVRIMITVRRWELWLLTLLLVLAAVGYVVYRGLYGRGEVSIVDSLGGNIFPSAIISTAATDGGEGLLLPCDTPYVGTPSSIVGVRVRSRRRNTRVRVELAETPFFRRTVSEFVLPREWTDYVVYPDMVWNYEALRQNVQATPVSVMVQVSVDGRAAEERVRTFSVRSLNECMLGYYLLNRDGKRQQFVNTRQLFAAYVNEDSPQIDRLLREALNTRIVNRFVGYQKDSAAVVMQVYALWNVLQRRGFKYSSISNSSLSSNVVFAQRVRTLSDALEASQINCVDGSVLFASLLKAVNINPLLVRLPGHMFVGFYTDRQAQHASFLETTMIGDVNLDDFFPEEKLDSTVQLLTKNEASRITFNKSMEYARRTMNTYQAQLDSQTLGYMVLPITRDIRQHIQPIGK